jgi:hypothetical protein
MDDGFSSSQKSSALILTGNVSDFVFLNQFQQGYIVNQFTL